MREKREGCLEGGRGGVQREGKTTRKGGRKEGGEVRMFERRLRISA